ncbi:Na/Pi cotransporter family protein [Paenibacillus turpanensis]|uniref:Na/Pi cotransporter family protein n=1 Tax=Paenibacillus turpanensis TaxID=2689078 RepID=UPI00140824E9|nr:Na/Pi symporter [Paenibacillus turpanensis]
MLNEIVIPLLVGLAIFLFGLKIMEIALHQWAGPYLQSVLKQFTKTPLHGLLTGTATTAVLQSSSAVTVITIGLVNSGLLTFSRTLGIILGTNIGTCLTTELIGLNIGRHALTILYVAAAVWSSTFLVMPFVRYLHKAIPHLRCLSLTAAGFACIMLGMKVMETITPALQSRGLFIWFLEHAQTSILWGVIAGMVITAVIQSGTATIGIAMGLAAVSAISVDLAVAITLGANIGSCSTGLIACIGSSKSAQFVAWSHVTLNLIGTALFLPFIGQLAAVSGMISSDPIGQIAHAQTIFNIVCSVLALPFAYLPIFRRMDQAPPPPSTT